MLANPTLLIVAALAGLVLGSYAVTAGLRLSRLEGSTLGRSHCDSCGVALGFAQTIPVASYLRLGGCCAGCGARIDPTHLVGELAGLVVVLSAVASGPPLEAALMSGLGLALLAAAAVDSKVRRLPDVCATLVALCGVGLSLRAGGAQLTAGLVASGACVLVLLALREAGRRRRGDPGLGLGDVKLIAALALWLGAATPVMVVVASGLGLLAAPWLRGADRRLPFGPMIAAAAWVVGIAMQRGWGLWVR